LATSQIWQGPFWMLDRPPSQLLHKSDEKKNLVLNEGEKIQ
jgi:hypothetical protein